MSAFKNVLHKYCHPRLDLGSRSVSVLAIALVLGLVACGGGGGGSTPAPVVTPPSGTLSVAPATIIIQAGLGKGTATATFVTANATTAKLTNAGGSVLSTSLSGTQAVDVFIGANTYTLSANGGGSVATASATGVCTSGTTSNGTICVSPVTATLSATSPIVNGAKSTLTWGYTGDAPTGCTTSTNWSNGGSLSGTGLSDALTTNATFTYSCTNANGTTTATAVVTVCAVGETVSGAGCVAKPWWPPTLVPMGVKVYLNSATAPAGAVTNATFPGQTESGLLPAACRITGDACWQEAVRNGTIKFVQTTAQDSNNRPMVFGFYKTVSTTAFAGQKLYCVSPIFADDGKTSVWPDAVESIGCATYEQVHHAGNALGEIFQEKNPISSVSTCFQKKFYPNLNGWANEVVSCS